MTSPEPPLPFQRKTLPDQLTQVLRQAIRHGRLPDPLPGEYTLAAQFGVSRPTLRNALQTLRQEGWILTSNGKPSRLNPNARFSSLTPITKVTLLCPRSRETLLHNFPPVLSELQTLLAREGIQTEEIFDARLARVRPESLLRELTASRHRHCWLILASTLPLQRWFRQSGLSTLILGSCHPGIQLPSLDLDYRAIGWHTAGQLLRYGHTRTGILVPEQPLAGDDSGLEGCLSYFRTRGLAPQTVVAKGGAHRLPPILKRLFHSSQPPSALFSMRPSFTLAAFTWLLASGFQVPGDVSLISRDNDPLLDDALPQISRYNSNTHLLSRKALPLIKALLRGDKLPPTPHQIMPEFIQGATLGASSIFPARCLIPPPVK